MRIAAGANEDTDSILQSVLGCMRTCDAIEDDLEDNLSDISRWAFQIYNMTSNQMITAGMGGILGINHQAIHEYMRTQFDFTKLEYRTVFDRVIAFDRIAAKMREKYKDDSQSANQRASQAQKTLRSSELPT